jgi:hypothetical protein
MTPRGRINRGTTSQPLFRTPSAYKPAVPRSPRKTNPIRQAIRALASCDCCLTIGERSYKTSMNLRRPSRCLGKLLSDMVLSGRESAFLVDITNEIRCRNSTRSGSALIHHNPKRDGHVIDDIPEIAPTSFLEVCRQPSERFSNIVGDLLNLKIGTYPAIGWKLEILKGIFLNITDMRRISEGTTA